MPHVFFFLLYLILSFLTEDAWHAGSLVWKERKTMKGISKHWNRVQNTSEVLKFSESVDVFLPQCERAIHLGQKCKYWTGQQEAAVFSWIMSAFQTVVCKYSKMQIFILIWFPQKRQNEKCQLCTWAEEPEYPIQTNSDTSAGCLNRSTPVSWPSFLTRVRWDAAWLWLLAFFFFFFQEWKLTILVLKLHFRSPSRKRTCWQERLCIW